MSVQSRTPVSGRNARFELDLIVQSHDTHFRNNTSASSNNFSVRVRAVIRFPFKLLFNVERQLAEETKKNSLSVYYT